MKKVIFALCAVALLFASCADKNAYTIKGTTDNTEENLKAYLSRDYAQTFSDSALVKDGRFEFSGVIEETQEVLVFVHNREIIGKNLGLAVFVFLEPGDITVTIKDGRGIVSGTALNDTSTALSKKMEGLEIGERLDCLKQGMIENINNALGEHLLRRLSHTLSPEEVLEVIASMPEEAQNREEIKAIKTAIEAEASFVSKVGKKFTDIKGLTIDGKEMSLSDYTGKGKVVLLDFWASWCGPCIQKLPAVKKAYEMYKDKGFEIVGVSLDNKHDAWKKATDEHEITWPQFSNLKKWGDPAWEAYGVRGIPYTVLIDKDGMIIGENMHSKEILTKLGELLDK